jgi:hypothetical protein
MPMITLDESALRDMLFDTGSESPLHDNLSALLNQHLAAGDSLFLEGIGVVRRNPDGALHLEPCLHPRVFLAYVVEDLRKVRGIFRFLKQRGFEPWMDVECLLPGQNWPRAIERAIEGADFVIPCFSRVATKKPGYFQAELRYALDCAALQPLDEAYLVPVRLDECEIPRSIQRQTQYVDLFPDPKVGLLKLLATLRGKQVPKERN